MKRDLNESSSADHAVKPELIDEVITEARALPAWREIEQRVRQSLAD